MRTNIVIDDDLMEEALRLSGAATKKDVVDRALRLLVRTQQQASIRTARGKLRWDGDLHAQRLRR
jgi:Arc/MetJ family transcription regulator